MGEKVEKAKRLARDAVVTAGEIAVEAVTRRPLPPAEAPGVENRPYTLEEVQATMPPYEPGKS